MATEIGSLLILPAIGMGIVIGIIEMFFLHGDEAFSGSHWLKHGLTHIFPVLIIALLISMNVDFFLAQFGGSLPAILTNAYILRGAIALVVTIKVYSGSAVVAGARGKGMHESFIHCIIIGGLVAVAPYGWPLLAPFMPSWLGGN
ncbi:hypothetical protein HN681_04705 [archaeon]|jgi:hypothetical protein|nr:hypothetical protein [archaeon]MBT3731008.1 hypothetical protein [archaeon]MBT4669754.1 hypothetical protein [archaeon]MBT5029904.1 hypothetical protein [archaeon]MBT5288476.1 hypothetical protein [archaeon]